jgi:GAF domain-containing protein
MGSADGEMLARMARYLDYFQALAEAAKSVTGTLDVHVVLTRAMETLTRFLKPRHWSLMLVDETRGELYFEIAVGDAADKIKGMRLRVGEGIAGWVVQNQQPLLVPKVADDPRFSRRFDQASDFQTASVLCAPLVCHGRVLGVIEIVKDVADPEPFSEEHLQVLAPLADFVAIAIENARAFKQVEELTITDEWTSLYNARFLRRCLTDEVARAQRYGRELSVVFLDLDGFKQVNDRHGHGFGSALLRHTASARRSCGMLAASCASRCVRPIVRCATAATSSSSSCRKRRKPERSSWPSACTRRSPPRRSRRRWGSTSP